jgi:hypothetical protein
MMDATARRVDRLAQELPVQDGQLRMIAHLANNTGLRYPVCIVTGGVVIRGGLGRAEDFAAVADRSFQTMWTSLFPRLDVPAEGRVFGQAVDRFREYEARRQATADKYGPDANLDDIADDDVWDYLGVLAPAFVINVVDAQVLINGAWTTVGAIRLTSDQVSAWWPLDSEEGVVIAYNNVAPPTAEATA